MSGLNCKSAVWFLTPLLALVGSPAQAQDPRVVAPPGSSLDLPFSPGILSDDFLFLSGAIPNQPGTLEIQGDVLAQTQRTLGNLDAVLQAAGLTAARIVDLQVYLRDLRQQSAVDAVLAAHPPGLRAARTTVAADIAIPDAALEIAAIAARPGLLLEPLKPAGWPDPPAGLGWGVRAGDTVFISAQNGRHPISGQLAGTAVGPQTRQALENIGAVLQAAGRSYSDVVSCRVYLADARDFAAMNDVYRTFFPTAPPARATLRAGLPDPELKIAVACWAAHGGERQVVNPAGDVPGARPLSPAIRVGSRLFLSGMVARRADGYPAGVAAQTREVLAQLQATLAAAGMDFRDVESATVYLADVRFYAAMNEVYRELVPQPAPARATVGTQLMSPEALVEIAMVASHPPATPAATP